MSLWNHLLCKPIMSILHKKCRNIDIPYIQSNIYRLNVSDNKVKWSNEWKDYNPPDYTDPTILDKPWADPDVTDSFCKSVKWNSVDGKINRVSYICPYSFDSKLRPINPIGRTGLSGRGILGRWGPNHAADPIVTRYNNGELEFVAIQRRDTGEWAIPGGMVDAGENVSQTLRREFCEEAMNGKAEQNVEELWKKGKELYRGYVDDPRNTDNAWMETVVVNFHDYKNILENLKLQAGDDAKDLRWIRVNSDFSLYASHEYFISLLKNLHFS